MQCLRLSLNTPAQRLSDVARCCAIPESSQRLGLQTGLDHIVAVKHGADWAEHGTRFLTLHAQAGKIPQRGGLEHSNLGGAPIYPSSVSLARHEVNVAAINPRVTSPPGVVLRLYLRVSCLVCSSRIHKLVSTPILAGAKAALSRIVAARLVPRHQWTALTSYTMEGRGWAGCQYEAEEEKKKPNIQRGTSKQTAAGLSINAKSVVEKRQDGSGDYIHFSPSRFRNPWKAV
ncbi:hypothetical protein B0H13DRAFT_1909556 [Mycena leptocephala]|nr:hypothetical protein B0H13DRAFT_1909556 [Mycena leptocephala]